MQTFFAILASAALATAAAVAGGESGAPKMGGATCAAGNTVACCDTSGGDGVLGNLLGGSCIIPDLLSSAFDIQPSVRQASLTYPDSQQQLPVWQHLLLPCQLRRKYPIDHINSTRQQYAYKTFHNRASSTLLRLAFRFPCKRSLLPSSLKQIFVVVLFL